MARLSLGEVPEDRVATEDDEFGLSSGDEEDLLHAEVAIPRKRKNEDATPSFATKAARTGDNEKLSATTQIATDVLKMRFNIDSFRLKQEAAIDRLLQGDSAVVVFPTGGGKSLCYQVPALCFKELDRQQYIRQGRGESGITLVVSPLIALMKDQVDALRKRGISAAQLDSSKSKEEYLQIVDSMRDGTLDILYCAPERLNNEGFVNSMAHVKGGVRLLAVDEAHCVSEWGHAFRPDYLKVARFGKEIEAERVVCLTATATPAVVHDVCKAFTIANSAVYRTPTYRSNLRLLARSFKTKKESYPELMSFLRDHPGPAIIYVTLQRHTEELAEQLRKHGFKACYFHAGMKSQDKIECQEAFMASSELIVVATIAFGMGIDKADIRNVIHYDIPRSLEGYSQEIGRAGRDGKRSNCLLYLCAEDLHLRESFARGDLPSKNSVVDLLGAVLSSQPVDTPSGKVLEQNVYQLSKTYDIKQTVLNNIFAQLELRFELLRATTPKYTSYSYIHLKDFRWDMSPAATAVRAHSKKAAKLTYIDVDMAANDTGVFRNDIVTKLNDLNDNRFIELRTGGVINVYRIMKPLPTTPTERARISDTLYEDLVVREQQDLARMKTVIDLITGKACFSRTLAAHFGDSLPDGKQECGHCSWCEQNVTVPRVSRPGKAWDPTAFNKILQAVAARDDPRFLARVAFGISSPRVTTEKLGKHPVFGSMENHDFTTLYKAFEKVCKG